MSIEFPTPKATLARFDLRPKKSFGQNFLADAQLVDRIAALAGETAHVIEIGAGLGGLTACLLARGHQVTAVERDRDLIPVLNDVLHDAISAGQLRVLEEDAKSIDVAQSTTPASPSVAVTIGGNKFSGNPFKPLFWPLRKSASGSLSITCAGGPSRG
jgi:16S rRNA A1518/A1519 N6-dimethyltransferase RsmA/KsgA/DIM1 with predicted DNA glycosylase/AP lyase activity